MEPPSINISVMESCFFSATQKAKELKKTVKPLMVAGKLDIPAIGGRKGLGGTLEKFTKFYQNLMILAEDYLGSDFGVFSFFVISKASKEDFPQTPHEEFIKKYQLDLHQRVVS